MEQIYPFGYLFIGQVPPLDFFKTIDYLLRELVFNHFCGNTTHDCKRRDVFGDNCSRSHNDTIANGHPIQNDALSSNPNIITNCDFFVRFKIYWRNPIIMPAPISFFVKNGMRGQIICGVLTYCNHSVFANCSEIANYGTCHLTIHPYS